MVSQQDGMPLPEDCSILTPPLVRVAWECFGPGRNIRGKSIWTGFMDLLKKKRPAIAGHQVWEDEKIRRSYIVTT